MLTSRYALMYKIQCIALLLFVFPATVLADIVPDNTHWVEHCAKIVNLADFPKFAFAVAYLPAPRFLNDKNTVIHDDSCIQESAKYPVTSLYLFAIYKSYLAEHSIETINFAEDKNVFKSNIEISSSGVHASNDDPLKREIIEYTIRGFNGQALFIYISKRKEEKYSSQELKIIRDQDRLSDKEETTGGNGITRDNWILKTFREKKK